MEQQPLIDHGDRLRDAPHLFQVMVDPEDGDALVVQFGDQLLHQAHTRFVDPGGVFMVHMFTHTSDRDVIDISVGEGTEETIKLIGEIEQSSALLASEDNDFLIRMGISRKLLTDIMYKQQAVASGANRSTRYCLSQDEVKRYNDAPMEVDG